MPQKNKNPELQGKGTRGSARVERVALDEALGMANPANPKEHGIDKLIASFNRFGFVAPPTVDEGTKLLVAGHGRCLALAKMRDDGLSPPAGIEVIDGRWMVPLLRGLSFANERERNAYTIADNQLTIAGGWKFDQLSNLLAEFNDQEFGFEGLGFEQLELDSLLGRRNDGEPDDGDDPEDDDKPGPRTTIVATVECPECGHKFER